MRYFASCANTYGYNDVFQLIKQDDTFVYFKLVLTEGDEHYVMNTLRLAEVKLLTHEDFKEWQRQQEFIWYLSLEAYKAKYTEPIWK